MRWLLLALFWAATPALAVTCEDITYLDNSYTACTVDAAREDLRLFHADENGAVLGSFSAVEQSVPDRRLAFAMNAGMYHPDRSPVGYYLENGVQTMRVVPNAGPGNFGLLPNGVFCITDTSAHVHHRGRGPDDTRPADRDSIRAAAGW